MNLYFILIFRRVYINVFEVVIVKVQENSKLC
jgi:hypothetical protein